MDNNFNAEDFYEGLYGSPSSSSDPSKPEEEDSGFLKGTADTFRAAGAGLSASGHGLMGKWARDIGDANSSNYANRRMIDEEKRRQEISEDFNILQHGAAGVLEAVPEVAAELGMAYATRGRSLAPRIASALGGQAVTYGKTTGDIYRDDLARHIEEGGTAEDYVPKAELDDRAEKAALASTVVGAVPGMLPVKGSRAQRIGQYALGGATASGGAQVASNWATEQDLDKDVALAAAFGAGADLGLRGAMKGGQKAVDFAKSGEASAAVKNAANKVAGTLKAFNGGNSKSDEWEAFKNKTASDQIDLAAERESLKDIEDDDAFDSAIRAHNDRVLDSPEYNFAEALKELQDEGFQGTPGSIDVEYFDKDTGTRKMFREKFGYTTKESTQAIRRSNRASPSMLRNQAAKDANEDRDSLRENNQKVYKRLTGDGLRHLSLGNASKVEEVADSLRAKIKNNISPNQADIDRLAALDSLSKKLVNLEHEMGRHLGFDAKDIDSRTTKLVSDIEKLAYKTNMYDKLQDYRANTGGDLELLRDIQKLVYMDKIATSQDRSIKFGTPDSRKQNPQSGTDPAVNIATAAAGGVPGVIANKLANFATLGTLNLKSQLDLRREKAKMERKVQELRDLAKRPAPSSQPESPSPVDIPPVTADDKFEESLVSGDLAAAAERAPEALEETGINTQVAPEENVTEKAFQDWYDAEAELAKAIGRNIDPRFVDVLEQRAIAAKAKYDSLLNPTEERVVSPETLGQFARQVGQVPPVRSEVEDEYVPSEQLQSLVESSPEQYVDPNASRVGSGQIASNQARLNRLEENRRRFEKEQQAAADSSRVEEETAKAYEDLAKAQEELAKVQEEVAKAKEAALDAEDDVVAVEAEISNKKLSIAQRLAKALTKPKKARDGSVTPVSDEEMDKAVTSALKSVDFEFQETPRVRDSKVKVSPTLARGVGSQSDGPRMDVESKDYNRMEADAIAEDKTPPVSDVEPMARPRGHDKWSSELAKTHLKKEIESLVRKEEKAKAEVEAKRMEAEEKVRESEEKQARAADWAKSVAARPELNAQQETPAVEPEVVPEPETVISDVESATIDEQIGDVAELDQAVVTKKPTQLVGRPLAELRERRAAAEAKMQSDNLVEAEAASIEVQEIDSVIEVKRVGAEGLIKTPLKDLQEARARAEELRQEALAANDLAEVNEVDGAIEKLDAAISFQAPKTPTPRKEVVEEVVEKVVPDQPPVEEPPRGVGAEGMMGGSPFRRSEKEDTTDEVGEAPVEEAPVKEAPVKEAPVEEAPVEEAPVKEAPRGVGAEGMMGGSPFRKTPETKAPEEILEKPVVDVQPEEKSPKGPVSEGMVGEYPLQKLIRENERNALEEDRARETAAADAAARAAEFEALNSEAPETTVTEEVPGTSIDDRLFRFEQIPRRQRMDTPVSEEDVSVEGSLADNMETQQNLFDAIKSEKLELQKRAKKLDLSGYQELDEILRKNDLSIQTATDAQIKKAIKDQQEAKVKESREEAKRATNEIAKIIKQENESESIANKNLRTEQMRSRMGATSEEVEEAFKRANALDSELYNERDVRNALREIVQERISKETTPEGFRKKDDVLESLQEIAGDKVSSEEIESIAKPLFDSVSGDNVEIKNLKGLISSVQKRVQEVDKEDAKAKASEENRNHVNREMTQLGKALKLSDPEIKEAISASGGKRGEEFDLAKARVEANKMARAKNSVNAIPKNHVKKESALSELKEIGKGYDLSSSEVEDIVSEFMGSKDFNTIPRSDFNKALKAVMGSSEKPLTKDQIEDRIASKTANVMELADRFGLSEDEVSKAFIQAKASPEKDFNDADVSLQMLKIFENRPSVVAPKGFVTKTEAIPFLEGIVSSESMDKSITEPILKKIQGLSSQPNVKETDVLKAVSDLYKANREFKASEAKKQQAADVVRKKNAVMEKFYKQHGIPGELRAEAKASVVTDANGDYNINELKKAALDLKGKSPSGYSREDARKNLISLGSRYGLDPAKAAGLVNSSIMRIPPKDSVDFDKYGSIAEKLFSLSQSESKVAKKAAEDKIAKEEKAAKEEKKAIQDLKTEYAVMDVNNLTHLSKDARKSFAKLLRLHNDRLNKVSTGEGKAELDAILDASKKAIEARQEAEDQLVVAREQLSEKASVDEAQRVIDVIETQKEALEDELKLEGMSKDEIDNFFNDNSTFFERNSEISDGEMRNIRTAALRKYNSDIEAEEKSAEEFIKQGSEQLSKRKAGESESKREAQEAAKQVEKHSKQIAELKEMLKPLGEDGANNAVGLLSKAKLDDGRSWSSNTFEGIKAQAKVIADARKKADERAEAAEEVLSKEADKEASKQPLLDEAAIQKASSQRDQVWKATEGLPEEAREKLLNRVPATGGTPDSELQKVLRDAKSEKEAVEKASQEEADKALKEKLDAMMEESRKSSEEAVANAQVEALRKAGEIEDEVREIFEKAGIPEQADDYIGKNSKAIYSGQDITSNASRFAKDQAEAEAAAIDSVVQQNLSNKTAEESVAYLNGLIDSLQENMSAGKEKLKALTRQFEAFNKAKEAAMSDIPSGDSKLAETYARVLGKIAKRKEQFKDDPDMWLSWDDLVDIKTAYRGLSEQSEVHKSSNVGSLWKNLRAMTFGNTGDRVFYTEKDMKDAISGKKPLGQDKGKLVKEGSDEGEDYVYAGGSNIPVRQRGSDSGRYRTNRSSGPSDLDLLRSRKPTDEGPDDTPPGGGGKGALNPAPSPEPTTPAKESPVGSQSDTPVGSMDGISLNAIKGLSDFGYSKVKASVRDAEQQKAVEAAGLDWNEFKKQYPKVGDRQEAVVKIYENGVSEPVSRGALADSVPDSATPSVDRKYIMNEAISMDDNWTASEKAIFDVDNDNGVGSRIAEIEQEAKKQGIGQRWIKDNISRPVSVKGHLNTLVRKGNSSSDELEYARDLLKRSVDDLEKAFDEKVSSMKGGSSSKTPNAKISKKVPNSLRKLRDLSDKEDFIQTQLNKSIDEIYDEYGGVVNKKLLERFNKQLESVRSKRDKADESLLKDFKAFVDKGGTEKEWDDFVEEIQGHTEVNSFEALSEELDFL